MKLGHRALPVVVVVLLATVSFADESKFAPNATVSTADLIDFEKEPKKVRKLIEVLLELTTKNLTYTYGSADPKAGGMDCSGTMYYALRKEGFKDVPRTASQQYRWIWEKGRFHAVVSSSADTFELAYLKPGDMLFWSGTYDVERDPPVTHSMIFLGHLKKDGRAVMVGASDGRSYDGKARNGVSVFDFRIPPKGSKSRFIGYGRLPGL
jgi:cell wall-associated NlpC family hydrolase